MPSLSTTLGLVAMASGALAVDTTFHPNCPEACLGDSNGNLLITKCQVSFYVNDQSYVWTQLDLNTILGYQNNKIVYQQNGNYSIGDNGCVNCMLVDRTMYCDCPGGPANLNLHDFIDYAGMMCYGNGNNPICGTQTETQC
ncbi:hypothetical protein SCUCBS95973_002322 [Sporothrix curviconia]|uniref:Cyanovirin-N domain-containing protein n=1 Tax=Sporothrix curviconia TaxID=1260050 RepID=A0ABP0B6R1_9PEZI